MLRKIILTSTFLAASLMLTSCYRIPVPQGNYFTQADANKIKKGMSTSEVVGTLGNPVLDNAYINGELAYVYTFKKSFSDLKQKRMIIYFNRNKVTEVLFDEGKPNAKLPTPSTAN